MIKKNYVCMCARINERKIHVVYVRYIDKVDLYKLLVVCKLSARTYFSHQPNLIRDWRLFSGNVELTL